MKELFLETEAAAQCLKYAKDHEWDEVDTQDLLDRCYQRGVDRKFGRQESFSDWLVRLCLQGDEHQDLTVDAMFTWGETPEGQAYWQKIYFWK